MDDINVFINKFPSKVLAFLLRQNSEGKTEVLMGIHHKQLKRNFPGGKVGDKPEFKGEEPIATIVRECEEELGIKINSPEKIAKMLFCFPSGDKVDITMFVVTEWEGVPGETSTHELLNPQWYEVDNLPVEEMWESDLTWLPYIFKNEYFEGRLIFDEDGDVKELYISEESKEMKEIRVV